MQQLSTLIIITNIFWVPNQNDFWSIIWHWTNGIWKFIFANKWHTNYNIITVLYANFGEHKAQEFPHMICFICLYKNSILFFWSDVWPSMVTHTQNVCSAFNPSKCTHTHSSEHTPGAMGSQYCGTRGAVGGSVSCSRVSPQSRYTGILKGGEDARASLTPPTIPAVPEIRTHNLGLQVQRSIH